MKTPDCLQSAPSVRASQEPNQQMHAILQSTEQMRSKRNEGVCHVTLLCLTFQTYLMNVVCADGLRRALLKALRMASFSSDPL